jgi:hypothetical protein
MEYVPVIIAALSIALSASAVVYPDITSGVHSSWFEPFSIGYEALPENDPHISAETYNEGVPLYYNVAAANNGSGGYSGYVNVRITLVGPNTNIQWNKSFYFSRFTTLRSLSVDELLGSFSAGAYKVTVEYDYTDSISESDETNNSYERWFIVGDDTYSSAEGIIFFDSDRDGKRDSEEPLLAGWNVYVDENYNGSYDAGEPNSLSDSQGNYCITGLSHGSYALSVESLAGWDIVVAANQLMSFTAGNLSPAKSGYRTDSVDAPVYIQSMALEGGLEVSMAQANDVVNSDKLLADPSTSGFRGLGQAVVVIDTGIDVDHPFFGPDLNSDGIADRIVYQYDFADSDTDASDATGHGSNVSSVALSSDSNLTGIAPEADIIALKVFTSSGTSSFQYVEQALQWVCDNAAIYNVASVNISLGDTSNEPYYYAEGYGIEDELRELDSIGVVVVCANGNDFLSFAPEKGSAYPASDKHTISVAATYDANIGYQSYSSGATAYSTGIDYICPFSQRDNGISNVMAPGAAITGANATGGTTTMHGSSQASPVIAGAIALIQQAAEQLLGCRLNTRQVKEIINATAERIYDGDDENDNVANTNDFYNRIDLYGMLSAVTAISQLSVSYVELQPGQINSGGDFALYHLPADINGDRSVDFADLLSISDCWLYDSSVAPCTLTDITEDGNVNLEDFSILAGYWLMSM